MPQTKIYNNVVGHRVYDDGIVCEDVTSISLPTISHPTTAIDGVGTVLALDVPDTTRVEAMEFGVSHNNGLNCKKLMTPGKHVIETRLVQQVFNQNTQEMEFQQVKYRVTGMHKSREDGTAETGNPLGSTDKYACLRYEKYVDGKAEIIIDTGKIEINDKIFTDQVEALL